MLEVPAWLDGSPSALLLFDGAVVIGASDAACRELGTERTNGVYIATNTASAKIRNGVISAPSQYWLPMSGTTTSA